ncbi:hypothetical protein V8C86DRAFT_2569161 [Haematococcus lacustris]
MAAMHRSNAPLNAAAHRAQRVTARPPARAHAVCRCSNASASLAKLIENPALQKVLAELDALHREDPRKIEVDGVEVPYELAYSQWLTEWVKKLTADGQPALSDELLIVAKGQHVRRWTSLRTDYPEGRAGYLKWREDLKKFHAATVTQLMAAAGYPQQSCAKVDGLINKKLLKEAEGQVVEDALCLVFMERQFSDLLLKEGHERMVDIVRKTWRKMGPKGRAAALTLALAPEEAAVVSQALQPADST